MEVQLVQISRIPHGLISSSVISESGIPAENRATKPNEVFVSVCSTGRVMAFVSPFKAQFIACDDSVCLNEGTLPNYTTSYEGLLHVVRDPLLPKPTATTCLVVPVTLESTRQGTFQTSSVVVIGFSDGYIRGYSKTGKAVFSQLLHPEPVVSLKVLSLPQLYGQTSYKSLSSLIVLLKGRVVCVVVGDNLTEVIKHNVSRRNADIFEDPDPDQQVPLIYKKFYLQEQSNITDVALLGQSTASAFDYLREASVVGGWDMTIRSGPVPEAKLVAVGEQPMVGLYRISKDAGTLNMSEVVHAVASRMTTAVLGKLSAAGGWLNWGGGGSGAKSASSQTPTKGKSPEEKQQPKMNLPMSTNIPDPRRHVTNVVVSPVGNLASLVDSFGRVMLLDIASLVIRRMWKGYRDAHCGWLVVADPSDTNRQAQCLCIYAPRRGILEFWPVQSGPRVAAFQVGKGCRLFHITRCLFGEERLLGELPCSNSGLENRVLLLSSDGRLLTFSVPFPLLIQCSSPRSHDSHMLMTLDQAVTSGNQELVCEVAESVKSSQALQEVLQFVINSYEDSDGASISRQTIMKVLNIAVHKTKSLKDFTVPEELHKHALIMRQLVDFYFNVLELSEVGGADVEETEPTNTISQVLQDYCKISFHLAERLEYLLCSYFQICEPVKRVRQVLRLTDFINCFEVYDKSVDCLLPSSKESPFYDTHLMNVTKTTVSLKKDLQTSVLIDLGEFIYKQLLLVRNSLPEVELLFKNSGVDSDHLLILLFQFWTSGTCSFHPSKLLLSVSSLFEVANLVISLTPTGTCSTDCWNDIQDIISSSHFPGHALLVTVFGSYLSLEKPPSSASAISSSKEKTNDKEDNEEEEEEDQWETVTVEREQWARLSEVLELLTELSLVVGSAGLKSLPPVLFIECVDDDGDGDKPVLHTKGMKMKMLFGESECRGVCVSVLAESGPALFGHGIARSIVSREIPANLVLELEKGSSQNVLQNIRNLSAALPHSLSVANLLVYCGFQAALEWSESAPLSEERGKLLHMVVNHISQVPYLAVARGVCGFLWHFLFEKEVVALSEAIKKKTLVEDNQNNLLFLWMCRSIISFLLKSNDDIEEGEMDRSSCKQEETKHDVINVDSPSGLMFLPAIVRSFPECLSDSLKLCMELLLLLEILLISGVQSNVFAFFPPSYHSIWLKGIYSNERMRDMIQKSMQMKRMKFLNGAVTTIINDRQHHVKPNANFSSLTALKTSTQLYDFSNYMDLVFGLAYLWDTEVDVVKTHWVANLFAAGKDEIGKQVFFSVHDKVNSSVKLLSLAGHLVLSLIHGKDKQIQAMVFSQSPPGVLEWMRKQASNPTIATLMSGNLCTSKPVISNLLNMIGPHLSASSTFEKTFHNVNNLFVLL